jgi:hypothetical protein
MNRLSYHFLPVVRYGIVFLMTIISVELSAQERGIYHLKTGEDLSRYQNELFSGSGTLFGNDKVIEMTIISDFKSFRKNKKDPEYQDAVYKFKLNDTTEVVNYVRIKPRGNFRRSRCTFPPIKLNFKETEFFSKATENLKTLKLVNTCQSGDTYQELIHKEYLTYRIFNLLTKYSFRVRLLKIDFMDSGKKNKSSISYGFIIEDIDELAKRLNAEKVDTKVSNQDLTDIDHVNRVTTFQFMIGNTDWSIPGLHNVKLIKSRDSKLYRPFAIPYDFDLSGLVDAPYAAPNPILPIKDVKTRLFRGNCRQLSALDSTFELFRKQKPGIIELIQSFPYSSNSSKQQMLDYIDEFYAIINDSKKAESYFSVNCK